MDFLKLPKRTSRNRKYGLTSVMDLGTPIGKLKDLLNEYSEFIDIAKIGMGSAYVTGNLKNKIELYKEFQIEPYCGGTLFEKCFYHDKIPQYLDYLKRIGISTVEISAGTLDISLNDRIDIISKIKGDFGVIAEVGSKDSDKVIKNSTWLEEMHQLLDAGCDYVITEGRYSGTAGIYDKSGTIKSGLISDLVRNVDCNKIIFEAPTSQHQMFFINSIGPNVNLGNVKINDVLLLEAQRCGLRSETFFLEER